MSKLFTILITLAIFATSSLAQTWYTNPANGHRYAIIRPETVQSWDNNEALAVSLGGHLASINDAVERDWLVVNVVDPYCFATNQPYEKVVWIGLFQPPNSPEPAGNWQWTTGEPLSFTDWIQGEPNNSGNGENYAEFNSSWNIGVGVPPGAWNDNQNWDGNSRVGLAEVVPEPASIAVLGIGLLVFRRRKTGGSY